VGTVVGVKVDRVVGIAEGVDAGVCVPPRVGVRVDAVVGPEVAVMVGV